MQELYCGFAQEDITPADPKTVYLDGYGYRVTPAVGVRDQIWAKACYIRSDGAEFFIVALDVCGLNGELEEKIRRYVRGFTGLKNEDFVLCATHTHAAPACGVLRDLPINYLYWNFVCGQVVSALERAKASATCGNFRFADGTPLTAPHNRRGQEQNIDRRVRVCGFFDENNALRGALASASCHAVCIQSYLISADYPSVLYKEAAERYPNVPFLFLQGRGADVEPFFEGDRWSETAREGMLSRLGKEFSNGVFSALEKMQKEGVCSGGLVKSFETLSVPLVYPERERLIKDCNEQKEVYLKDGEAYEGEKRCALVEWEWCGETLERLDKGAESFVSAEIQSLLVKEGFAFAFVPFELFTQTGNAVEKMLSKKVPKEHIFVIGYCNGVNGYLIPSSESGKEGYESKSSAHWYNLPGEYDERAEQIVLSALEKMQEHI